MLPIIQDFLSSILPWYERQQVLKISKKCPHLPVKIEFLFQVVARGSGPPNGRIPMIPDGFSSVSDALRNFVAIFSDRFCSTPQTQVSNLIFVDF